LSAHKIHTVSVAIGSLMSGTAGITIASYL
jgi:hypothetical protein